MLASTSAQFLANATSTFQNISWEGSATSPVYLRSSASGTPWGLLVPGEQQMVSYVNVQDSHTCSAYPLITALYGTSWDQGGNTCWIFYSPYLSSADNQVFGYNQATTTMSALTLSGDTITATNDIRIRIATSSVHMLWDTTDTTATITGTASGKVSTTVSYENGGATLVLDVTSDFTQDDTITISDLSYSQFSAVNAGGSALILYTEGASDTTAEDTDDKTVIIQGSLTISNHTSGQVVNGLRTSTETATPLFAFKLNATGETMNITSLAFPLSGVNGIVDENVTNVLLYRDIDSSKTYDGGDIQVGGVGAVSIVEQRGTLTFSTPFTVSTTTSYDYLLIADVANLKVTDTLTLSLRGEDMTTVGNTLGLAVTEIGSVSAFQHMRGGGGGGSNGGAVGGPPPEGQGMTTGGTAGGGQAIDPNTGDTIGNEVGWNAPSTNGTPYNVWTAGANGYSSDGVYATANSSASQSYAGFSFNIPLSNAINGIGVKLEASGSTASGTVSVRLSWDGGSTVTSLQTTGTLGVTDAVYTLGGPSDTWGHTWTPGELNDTFTLEIIANPDGNAITLDAVQVHVYHQATGGGQGGGGPASVYEAGKRMWEAFVSRLWEWWRW